LRALDSGIIRSVEEIAFPGELPQEIPRIPASAGALLFDCEGRLLIVNPTYKKHWTIPGGQIEEGGETPWEACRRETHEECGIQIEQGRLVCVDVRPAKGTDKPGGLRFLFHCGTLRDEQIAQITLQAREISEYRFAELDHAAELLSGPVRRRVLAGARTRACVYLEDGRPVPQILTPDLNA
jgi:8-oxo-dGTP diphosphatase